MSKVWVLGDVHGANKALVQVLERAKFDYANDTLIALGDICDGWSEVAECFETLLKIPNLIYIQGNHDQWFLDYKKGSLLYDGIEHWFKFGGLKTVESYHKNSHLVDKHVDFLKQNAKDYYVDKLNRVFTHSGIPNQHEPLNRQVDYCWDRNFYKNAIVWHKQNFAIRIPIDHTDHTNLTTEWFVGHTPVSNFKHAKGNVPLKYSNINFIDTGAAFDGVVTLMNVDTYEFVQSDIVKKLYPTEKGRNNLSYADEQKKKIADDTETLW